MTTESTVVRFFSIGVQYGYTPNQLLHPRLLIDSSSTVRVVGRDEDDCRDTFMDALMPWPKKWSHCYETSPMNPYMSGSGVDLQTVLRERGRSKYDWAMEIRAHIQPLSGPSARIKWLESCMNDWAGYEGNVPPTAVKALEIVRIEIVEALEAERSP